MTDSAKEKPTGKKRPPDVAALFELLDRFPIALALLDRNGTILRVSDPVATYVGRAKRELLGLDFFREVLPELETAGFGERFRDGSSEELGEAMRLSVQTPAGERLFNIVMHLAGEPGNESGIVLLEDRSMLAAEEKRRKRAESLASVGELAASLAHEVNNPLASIKSFAQLLVRESTTGEQRHALELIVQESDRIGKAVENLVAFARQQGASGREPVNLSTLAERVIDVRRYSLETAGIEVRLDLDASISPIMGESGALQQVILNLVTRAEQDLASRRDDRMLIVRTRESSEGVVLYVVDNGPGIPRDALPHLFDATGTEGQGLELSTAARIIRDHGGYILAESEPGRGVAFFVRLPRAGAPPISAPPDAAAAPAALTAKRPLRVLVADDEPTLRLAISLFLNRRGHHVTQAADAYEALELANQQQFDVALVDARMPGDGLALLEQLEAMPALAGRTALMTGDLGRARTTQGIPTGRPYLVKPFDMNEAVTLIERLADQESV
ncbi:MAG: ATP-binding protein [Gemmatimonadota bacterium]